MINCCTFNANTQEGYFIKIRKNSNVNITLNNVTYNDTGSKSKNDLVYILDASLNNGNSTLTINGDSFTGVNGFVFNGMNVTIKDAYITADKWSVEASYSVVNIENCVVEQKFNDDEYVCALYASNVGVLKVSNCTIKENANYAYGILPTGGTLVASNNTISTKDEYCVYKLNEGKTASVTINGVLNKNDCIKNVVIIYLYCT